MNKDITSFERSCRVCLTPVNKNFISLLGTIVVDELSITISSALQEVCPFFVEITKRDDCLPSNICLECLNNLKTSYRFRKICETNNRKILEILSEHDNLEKENVQLSKHYKYNIARCWYFKDQLIKNEATQLFSDFDSTEQADQDADFKEERLEVIEQKVIDTDLKHETVGIGDGILKKESISVDEGAVISNKLKCKNCSKTFQSLSEFRSHKKSHEDKYHCDLCIKTFSTKRSLDLHKHRHTSNLCFTHLCPECGKRFLTSAELVRHTRTHGNIKLYQCNICLKKFSQCYTLKLHKMRHIGYRPNVCEICDKRFTTTGNLNEHKLTHMAEKPHKCKVCAKTCITQSDLKKHMRTHSGEKPYSCQYCKRSFARKETLKVHLRTHTGEKPYSCNVCHKRFVHLSSLDRHVKSRCDIKKVDPLLNI